MRNWLLLICFVLSAILSPKQGEAQEVPPPIVIEENTNLATGIMYQKWNVREITEVFQEKDFNGPILAVLYPGDLVWGLTGDVHSIPNGKIMVTRERQTRGGKLLREGDILYPLYSMGNGLYKFWHQGDVLLDSVLDVRGMFSSSEARLPIESKVWGVVLEEVRRPSNEEWWVKVRLSDDRTGWTKRPYHFGNNGLLNRTGVTVIIDKRLVVFDMPPLIDNGTLWVPVSKLAEHFGAVCRWDADRGMVTVSLDGREVQFVKDSKVVIINGTITVFDASPRMVDGKLYVPVRAAAEAFGRTVQWDSDTRQALITER